MPDIILETPRNPLRLVASGEDAVMLDYGSRVLGSDEITWNVGTLIYLDEVDAVCNALRKWQAARYKGKTVRVLEEDNRVSVAIKGKTGLVTDHWTDVEGHFALGIDVEGYVAYLYPHEPESTDVGFVGG